MVDNTCDFNPDLVPSSLTNRFVTVLQEIENLNNDRNILGSFVYELDSLLKSYTKAREVLERSMVEINGRVYRIVEDVLSLNAELMRLKKEEEDVHSLMERSKGELRELDESLQAKDDECVALMDL